MTRSQERTILPPEDGTAVAKLARALAEYAEAEQLRLVGPDGESVEVPAEVRKVVVDVVDALTKGRAVTVAPINTLLTTQQAAELLGVSRPTLVRLLTDGEIPHTMRGTHRRVGLQDVLDYDERRYVERGRILDQMVAEAEEAGLYEWAIEPVRTR